MTDASISNWRVRLDLDKESATTRHERGRPSARYSESKNIAVTTHNSPYTIKVGTNVVPIILGVNLSAGPEDVVTTTIPWMTVMLCITGPLLIVLGAIVIVSGRSRQRTASRRRFKDDDFVVFLRIVASGLESLETTRLAKRDE